MKLLSLPAFAVLCMACSEMPTDGGAAPEPAVQVALASTVTACDGLPQLAALHPETGSLAGPADLTITTVAGSEVVRNLGLPNFTDNSGRTWYLTLFDACGSNVTEQNRDEVLTVEITTRPPTPEDATRLPGSLGGAPSQTGCPVVTASKISCVWTETNWKTVYFQTEVAGWYVLTLSIPGYRALNLCISASGIIGEFPSSFCTQPLATPALMPTASGDIILGGTVSNSAGLAFGDAPTGTITFNLFGPDDATCAGAATFTGIVAVSGNGSYDSGSFTPSATGVYRWRVAYSGDARNTPASTPCNAPDQSVTVSAQPTPPTVTVGGPTAPIALGPDGASAAIEVGFTDPAGGGPYAASVECGDGSTAAAAPVTSPHTLTCVYAAAGVYTVTASVTDGDGQTGQALFQYVVVYDPAAGFVTGGGWIDSPAGAYMADPSLAGKATFGFVSRYKKGATVPSGNTEFQFKAGDLNFKSTSYQWLVISGARAQFKGEGTIDGAGTYGFLLTAVDGAVAGGGGTDRFRIKITDPVTGAVVYDNQPGEDDDSDATTALGGGSIVIHNPK